MSDREQIKSFYKTKAWQRCRDGYAASVGGLCERCKANGMIVSGEIVHHKIHLNARNVMDESVALNWDNLELLCRKCHGDMHRTVARRYTLEKNGHVHICDDV